MTVQLECFIESVRFIRVFEWNSVYKINVGISESPLWL